MKSHHKRQIMLHIGILVFMTFGFLFITRDTTLSYPNPVLSYRHNIDKVKEDIIENKINYTEFFLLESNIKNYKESDFKNLYTSFSENKEISSHYYVSDLKKLNNTFSVVYLIKENEILKSCYLYLQNKGPEPTVA